MEAPGDVEKLLGYFHVGAALRRTRPIVLRRPRSGEIRFAVGCSRHGRFKVRRSVGQFRNAGRWIVEPLREQHQGCECLETDHYFSLSSLSNDDSLIL